MSVEANRDFETVVRNMMKTGATAEEVAKKMSDTLNTIRKEQEKEKQEKAEKERLDRRAKRYQELDKLFNKACASDKLQLEDVGNLAAVIVVPEHPEWAEDDINEFVRGVVDSVKLRATMVGKSPLEGLRAICSKSKDTDRMNKTRARECWSDINELERLLSDIWW